MTADLDGHALVDPTVPKRMMRGLTDEEVDIFLGTLRSSPGQWMVLSYYASQQSAAARVSQMKTTKRWGHPELTLKSRRMPTDDNPDRGAIVAMWDVERVGTSTIDIAELSDDEIRALIVALKERGKVELTRKAIK